MNIQSVSLDVPGGCPNKCKFCVSNLSKSNKMLKNVFKFDETGRLEKESIHIQRHFIDRLQFLKDKSIDTLVLTGTSSEPHLNKDYLSLFDECNRLISSPFVNIEIQTSGVSLSIEKLDFLENIGIKTVSLSISSFYSDVNAEINQTPKALKVNIKEICKRIKDFDMNLRLSLNINMMGFGHFTDFGGIFKEAENLEADQVTFRRLYFTYEDIPENKWIKENEMWVETDQDVPRNWPPFDNWWKRLNRYIETGIELNKLPFGATKYSIRGISTVVDEDCMNKKNKEDIKYMILRRNCKIYTEWNDSGSLVF